MSTSSTISNDASKHAETADINELIEVLNDSIAFYKEASEGAIRPDLKALFHRMIAAKTRITEELAQAIQLNGDTAATSGTLAGSMRKLYAEVRTKMALDKNYEYVAQLEEFEDQILHTFQAAVGDESNIELCEIAGRYMTAVKVDHDLMRDLKIVTLRTSRLDRISD